MKERKWLGIVLGTLVSSAGFWIGLFAIERNRTTGLALIALGIVFGMYTMAVAAGVEDVSTVAFHAALYAMVSGSTLAVIFSTTGSPSFLVAAPTFAIAVGGATGLPPVGDRRRTLARLVAAGIVSFIVVAVYWVDITVYAMIAPILALPAVGLADRVYDAALGVIAESA